ncbi:hypothetical protein Z947_3612 [Sulfitobacter geojensis]|nr:hypothetical protein Z947_3612 [Sulfitobacter geojensis]
MVQGTGIRPAACRPRQAGVSALASSTQYICLVDHSGLILRNLRFA